MFTGLVEELGTLKEVRDDGPSSKVLRIASEIVSQDASIGDSISINGCCLTVVAINHQQELDFQAGSETLSRTNLGTLRTGDRLNLERALPAGARLGGHYVSGHIDGLGQVDSRNDDGEWSEFWITVDEPLTRQMASKGSVAVDGVSLTLVNVERNRFSIAMIPHTLDVTTLGSRNVGDVVNIETDILAKYVQQQLARQEA